ncbi:MAG: ATP phosphoribosyltransferase regulatory subunit, partial [Anaerolineales bacterium]
MAKNVIRSVKGTRDYYPEEMGIRTWLYQKMRKVRLTLRPELTPTLARMVATRQNQLTFPLRWWSFGPFWRYERPQKGRTREFFQWNIDMIGDDSPEADAELVAIAATFLREVGLKPAEVQIMVNNRRLMDAQLGEMGITQEARPDVFNLIDRRDKMSEESWLNYGADLGLSPGQLDGIVTLIQNKDLWQESAELVRLFRALETYGIQEYVQFAPHIIRGLVYYTGTVFEAWDTSGEHRAIFGGGRYDNLVADVGGDPVGGVGFAVGDLVLTLILQDLNRVPDFSDTTAPVFFTLFDEELLQISLELANQLRESGIRV